MKPNFCMVAAAMTEGIYSRLHGSNQANVIQEYIKNKLEDIYEKGIENATSVKSDT